MVGTPEEELGGPARCQEDEEHGHELRPRWNRVGTRQFDACGFSASGATASAVGAAPSCLGLVRLPTWSEPDCPGCPRSEGHEGHHTRRPSAICTRRCSKPRRLCFLEQAGGRIGVTTEENKTVARRFFDEV